MSDDLDWTMIVGCCLISCGLAGYWISSFF
jgi:hypothetical protein